VLYVVLPPFHKKASQLYLDSDVYRHILVIDISVCRKGWEAFFRTEWVIKKIEVEWQKGGMQWRYTVTDAKTLTEANIARHVRLLIVEVTKRHSLYTTICLVATMFIHERTKRLNSWRMLHKFLNIALGLSFMHDKCFHRYFQHVENICGKTTLPRLFFNIFVNSMYWDNYMLLCSIVCSIKLYMWRCAKHIIIHIVLVESTYNLRDDSKLWIQNIFL
jgi:hypothetical protein